MCISESPYLFSLYWFKHNEKFNGDSTNKASIDLSPIEVMANPPVLLMLDQLSEIRIIWEHKAWVCSSPPLLLALSPLYVLPLPNDSKKLYYNNKQGFRLPSNNKHNTYTHILLSTTEFSISIFLCDIDWDATTVKQFLSVQSHLNQWLNLSLRTTGF